MANWKGFLTQNSEIKVNICSDMVKAPFFTNLQPSISMREEAAGDGLKSFKL